MKPYISYSSRSALIQTPKLKIIYGEEVTDETTQDYCFVIYKNDKEVFRATNSELLAVSNGEGLKDIVIAGLAQYLSK